MKGYGPPAILASVIRVGKKLLPAPFVIIKETDRWAFPSGPQPSRGLHQELNPRRFMDEFRDIGAFAWEHSQLQVVVLHPQAGMAVERIQGDHHIAGVQKVMVSPPSTVITCPVRYVASGPARKKKTPATSSGSPARRKGR